MVHGVRERQRVYGLVWGTAAFVFGWVVVYLILPADPLGMEASEWKQVSWIVLNLNNVEVSGAAFSDAILAGFQIFDFTRGDNQWSNLRFVPVAASCIGGILTNVSMGRTRRLQHHLLNSLFVPAGYVIAGLGLIVASDARPGMSLLLLLFVIGGAGLMVGSAIAEGVGVPVIAITSLGGLALLGIVVLAGIWLVVQMLIPMALLSLVGSVLGGGLIYAARNMPW